jgi:Leucine-rich repeat (LRR) protein
MWTKKQVNVPLKILNKGLVKRLWRGEEKAQSKAFLNTTVDSNGKEWIIFPVKILLVEKDNHEDFFYNYGYYNYDGVNRTWQVYQVVIPEILLLDEIDASDKTFNFPFGGENVKLEYLELCIKDSNNKIPNPDDILFAEREVFFYLDSDWCLGKIYDEEGIDEKDFSLIIRGDYKIVDPESKRTLVSFTNQNFQEAQPYVNQIYPKPEEVKSIDLSGQWLKGTLNLNQFTNLEVLDLANNQISKLQVDQCLNLKHLDIRQNNNLTELIVERLDQFERLKADTGEFKKSSIFGGKSEWESANVGNINVAPLRINQIGIENKNGGKNLDLSKTTIYGIWNNNSDYAGGIIKTINLLEEEKELNLVTSEFAQLKRRIIDEVITPFSQDWTIREEPNANNSAKITFLCYKDAKLERDSDNRLLPDIGKVHFKKGFAEKEWKEIEKLVRAEKITAKFQYHGIIEYITDEVRVPYYVFISENEEYKLEIHNKHDTFKGFIPGNKYGKETNKDLNWYEITFLTSNKNKRTITPSDYVLAKKIEKTDQVVNNEERGWLKNLGELPWIWVIVAVFALIIGWLIWRKVKS